IFFFFFFQAEDGIRDGHVTGVQTCALPILRCHADFHPEIDRDTLALFLRHNYVPGPYTIYQRTWKLAPGTILSLRSHDDSTSQRSEERRVGKECRARWSPDDETEHDANRSW